MVEGTLESGASGSSGPAGRFRGPESSVIPLGVVAAHEPHDDSAHDIPSLKILTGRPQVVTMTIDARLHDG